MRSLSGAAVPWLLAVVTAGCGPGAIRDRDGDGWITVACLGDSNTKAAFPGVDERSWCDELATRLPSPPWRTVNCGRNGASACHTSRVPSPEEEPFDAAPLLARLLAHDRADVVLLALGTNDVIFGCDTEAIVVAYRELVAHAAPLPVMIALTPPLAFAEGNEQLEAVNRRIAELDRRVRAEFPASSLVDFASGFAPEDYLPDGLHLGPSGQMKRAERAAAALLARAR